jgi:CRP/FNR family transcriptional regulator, anaerobic regulatory protein
MVTGLAAIDGLTAYEWLLRLPEAGRERLARGARPVHAPPSVLLLEGDACRSVTLLSRGRVRVTTRRASGRALTLYTVGPGELCVLEVLAVLTERPFRAEAAVDETITGVSVAADVFHGLVHDEPGLREVLFGVFEARLASALEMIGDVALESLEARLATVLLRRAGGASGVHLTHEQLAHELACAREAVSRILEHWEQNAWVRLGRAHIQVISPAELAALAGHLDARPGGRRAPR